jgi:hypothetical protein
MASSPSSNRTLEPQRIIDHPQGQALSSRYTPNISFRNVTRLVSVSRD